MRNNEKNLVIIGIVAVLIIAIALIFLTGNKSTGNAIKKDLEGCGEGTIYYNNDHGLCWQRSVMPRTAENWDYANSYCENLTLAGKDDWRLPSLDELRKIVYKNGTDIKINTDYFKDTPDSNFWTTTQNDAIENSHWYMNFRKGVEGYTMDYKPTLNVRCVRTNSIF